MNINIDIEKLILEGMPISPSQARLLQAAVAAELERLLANEGLPDNLLSGGVVPGGAIQLKPGTNPTQMGQQIAQEIVIKILGKQS
ncbi:MULTISPECIES: hypothetical protein [unclassified Nostoc]|uniref:hypothetical protein n=1 Tax=unclassified Nostoc TaxID=2593658 RepID=UPI002602CF9C|nr:hypothetical protein [Nostoc sp. S13]MDF5738886.1 hypothetical protein [Nostoc sp. S13]